MKMGLVSDCLSSYSFEEMVKIASSLEYQRLELATGNWSSAPHLNMDQMLDCSLERDKFKDVLKQNNIEVDVLNCSGNQLAPNDDGVKHQETVEKTFRLAELLGVKKVVMMSGLPGGSDQDTTANWITTSWPPVNLEILQWQWEEVAIPYWKRTVKLAEAHGIEKIALENHGSQLVYNTETFLRLRNEIGSMIGINLDPSHLLWMGGDPIVAARELGSSIYNVHAKDTRIEKGLSKENGILDTKSIDQFSNRSWNYVALGHGQSLEWWKEFFSVLSMEGYNGTVSLENEDMTMEPLVALKKSTKVLKEALPIDFS